jgi:hypothetical protein
MTSKKGSTKKQIPHRGYIGFLQVKDAREAKAWVKKKYDVPTGSVILATRVPVKSCGKNPLPYPYIYEIEVFGKPIWDSEARKRLKTRINQRLRR